MGLDDTWEFASPSSLGVMIFLILYYSLTFLIFVFVVGMLIIRRKHKIIQARSPATLIPLQIFYFANNVVVAASIIQGKPHYCGVLNILYALVPVMASHFDLNIPNMVFQNDINNLKLARSQGQMTDRVWRIIRLFDTRNKFIFMVVLGLFHGALVACLYYLANLPGDCLRPSLLAYAIHVLCNMSVLGYFLVKFGKVKDPYFCKLENDIGSVFMLGQIFIMLTYPIFPQMYFSWFDYRWLTVVIHPITLLVNGLFPVLLTFDSIRFRMEVMQFRMLTPEQRQEMGTAGVIYALKQGVDIFQAVLENAILLEAFIAFSVKEWSVENVLFYQAVRDFKETFSDSKETANKGEVIIKEYVAVQAPMEVNLDHSVKKQILSARHHLAQDTFDLAQKQIFHLMELDTFAKWQKTVDFKEALERVVTGRGSDSRSSNNKLNTQSNHSH